MRTGLRERRVDVRAHFGGPVELTGGEGPRWGRASDLSRGGLGAMLPAPHPEVGARLEAEFRLPGFVLPVLVGARVVWTDAGAGRIGLSLDGIEPAVGELIEHFVAHRFGGG